MRRWRNHRHLGNDFQHGRHRPAPASVLTVTREELLRCIPAWHGNKRLERRHRRLLQSSSVSPNSSDNHARRHKTHFFDLEVDLVALVHFTKKSRGTAPLTALQADRSDTANTQGASANIRLRWNYRPDSDLIRHLYSWHSLRQSRGPEPAAVLRKPFRRKARDSW